MVVDKIEHHKDFYDNVHGFIKVTKLETEIIDSVFFQRLRNISQLGLLNYVFPGALHNRFNHSLGVMHIADKMIASLQEKGFLSDKREIIRMAALLHDIGHYPLSHLIESVVKDDAKSKIPTVDISIEDEVGVTPEIDISENEIHKLNVQLHELRNPSGDFAHHERISNIVISKTEIYDILLKHFSEDEIKEIMQIISGVYPGPERLIIHSELDADRFDYLLRDSHQTGVIYGLFDIDQIIRNLELYEPEDNRLVVDEKGRKALEHYLMGRYFLYSSILYHKTMVGFDLMAKVVYEGLMERKIVWSYFDLIDTFKTPELANYFLNYTDANFFNSLRDVLNRGKTWDVKTDYRITDDLLFHFINRILRREPLKLFYEYQKLIKRDEKYNCYLMEPAVKDRIVKLAEIEDCWYIPFKLNIPITEISPYKSLSDEEIPQEKEYETIKIIKTINLEEKKREVNYLVEDKTSVINILGEYQLNINRIYTKNQDYKLKLKDALEKYNAER